MELGRKLAGVSLLAFSLTACAGGGAISQSPVLPATATASSGGMYRLAQSTALGASASSSGILIDAGSSNSGSGWVADTDYRGGGVSTSAVAVNTSHVTAPAPQAVYMTQRYGSAFSYTISGLTAQATYAVRLHLAETFFTSAGKRVFNATVNGAPAVTNFDIFKAAGGKNIAVIESVNTQADSSGSIAIAFTSSVNYASVGGIEIDAQSSVKSASTSYPIYSSAFTGNTPFHHTVAELMAAGGTVRSSTVARNYWAQGFQSLLPGRQSGGEGPIYTVASGDPAYKFSCPAYGTCNAAGLEVHYPAGAYPETGTDHHIASFDPVYLKGEVDGWGGDGKSSQQCALASGTQTCSWGGFFPFSGSGLATNYSSGDAAGYAQGLMLITAQELLQGHIDHALGIASSCVDGGGVYPAIVGRATDAACPANEEPNARYGDLIHLKSSVDVAALGYSPYCKVVAQALQTYGAYTTDTNGSWGLALNFEYMDDYTGTNPWYTTIFPSMVAGGDGRGSDANFNFSSCLSRIPADDIEVIEISSKLPSA